MIFIQEPSKEIHKIFPQSYKGIEYDSTQNDEAGILNNKSNLMCITSIEPNKRLNELRNIMVRQNRLTNADELISRMHAVVLGIKGTTTQILCVSYHGPYKKKIPIRLEIIEGALQLLNEYQMEVCLPVIFGGDFNVDIQINLQLSRYSKIPTTPTTKPTSSIITIYGNGLLQLHPYQPTGRRDNIYDFILTSDSIKALSLKAIDIFEEAIAIHPNILHGDDKAKLDHDPLLGTISIMCTRSPLHLKPYGFEFEAYILDGNKEKVDHKERSLGKKTLLW